MKKLDIRLPASEVIMSYSMNESFDINNSLISNDTGIHIIEAVGCYGTQDRAHGLAIALVRGNKYYSAIFIGLTGGLYYAASNGDVSYVNWIKMS